MFDKRVHYHVTYQEGAAWKVNLRAFASYKDAQRQGLKQTKRFSIMQFELPCRKCGAK